jgi:hypothetical protein
MTGLNPGLPRGRAVAPVDGDCTFSAPGRPDPAHPGPARPSGLHRGRHTALVLGEEAVPVAQLADGPAPSGVLPGWLGAGRHRLAAGHPAVPGPRGPTLGGATVRICRAESSRDGAPRGYDDIEVYAAASLARRSAKDTLARLARCRDRVCIAARTASCGESGGADLSTGAAAIAGASAYRTRAIQQADRLLGETLDDLDAAKAVVGEAERVLRRYHPHGGSLVVTLATRRVALDRVARATTTATTRHHLADSATYTLVKEIVAGERAVRAVDALVDYLLDHNPDAAAPPAFLRLVRTALPRTQQLDWWRELCSLFAECRPDERRAQTTSQILNAPRTVWTSWSTARHTAPAPTTDDDPT